MKNVLLIDPNRAVRETYSDLIRQAGHAVLARQCGEEGLRVIEAGHKPDLVVVNIRLPHMTGVALCEAVKKKWEDVPIIAMSGPRDVAWLSEASRINFEAWLVQPAEPEVFLNIIQAMLNSTESKPNSQVVNH